MNCKESEPFKVKAFYQDLALNMTPAYTSAQTSVNNMLCLIYLSPQNHIVKI